MGKLFNVEDGLDLSKKNGDDVSLEVSTNVVNMTKVKFEIYGEEMIKKVVKSSGNSGRVYLPPDWVGCHVKVIKVD